jgi:hypothetical protein
MGYYDELGSFTHLLAFKSAIVGLQLGSGLRRDTISSAKELEITFDQRFT